MRKGHPFLRVYIGQGSPRLGCLQNAVVSAELASTSPRPQQPVVVGRVYAPQLSFLSFFLLCHLPPAVPNGLRPFFLERSVWTWGLHLASYLFLCCSNWTCFSLQVSLTRSALDILGDLPHVPPRDFSEEGSADVNILIFQIKIQAGSEN